MKDRIAAIAGALVLAALLVPGTAQAGHCADVLVFTGPTDQIPANPATTGFLNLGAAGCTNAAAHADTNFITPGAAFVRIGAVGTAGQPASGGQIKFNNGAFQSFAFTHNGTRWISPVFAIPAGTTKITAKATTTNTGSSKTETVVYNAIA